MITHPVRYDYNNNFKSLRDSSRTEEVMVNDRFEKLVKKCCHGRIRIANYILLGSGHT